MRSFEEIRESIDERLGDDLQNPGRALLSLKNAVIAELMETERLFDEKLKALDAKLYELL